MAGLDFMCVEYFLFMQSPSIGLKFTHKKQGRTVLDVCESAWVENNVPIQGYKQGMYILSGTIQVLTYFHFYRYYNSI